MSAIVTSAPSPTALAPIEILQLAIRRAHALGIRVRVGEPGVACTSTHGPVRWELDQLAREEDAVDALGALVLAEQPPAMTLHDAAARALGVHVTWIAGLADGMALAAKDSRLMQSGRRALYAHGYESGVLLRLHVASFPGGGGRP
jgi:hypothetical protein